MRADIEWKQLDKFGKGKRKMLGNYPGRDSVNSISAFLIGQLVGGFVIVLECREHMYDKFYKNIGFKKFRNELNEDGLYVRGATYPL